jgi:SAM-dependent methyltransferase
VPEALAEPPVTTEAEETSETYDARDFERLFAVEDRHFWFRARNHILSEVFKKITAPLPDNYRVLEVGCGTGNVLRHLERCCEKGIVVGMDLYDEGLQFARRRTNCPLLRGDMRRPPFRQPFDVIGLFDVLEHLPDDREILGYLHEMLGQGGALVLTVPAHMSLWSYFDDNAHHCRRYTVAELRDKLTAAGFKVEFSSQFMSILYPLVWASRRINSARSGYKPGDAASADQAHQLVANDLKITPGLNGILAGLLSLEALPIRNRVALPIGTSILAVARKV